MQSGLCLACCCSQPSPRASCCCASRSTQTSSPDPQQPNFVDNLFDNKGVILAARLLLVSAAGVLAIGGLYTVVSTVVRMKNREWLKRAGPFEVSEQALDDLTQQVEYWRTAAMLSQQESDELRAQVEQSDEMLRQLYTLLDSALEGDYADNSERRATD